MGIKIRYDREKVGVSPQIENKNKTRLFVPASAKFGQEINLAIDSVSFIYQEN